MSHCGQIKLLQQEEAQQMMSNRDLRKVTVTLRMTDVHFREPSLKRQKTNLKLTVVFLLILDFFINEFLTLELKLKYFNLINQTAALKIVNRFAKIKNQS